MDDAPGKFSMSALRFLRVLLNWYTRVAFGILSLESKVLYELIIFDFVSSEKLLCPGTTGVLLKADCLWDFLLTSTGIFLNGVNESVNDFLFASSTTKIFSWNSIPFSLSNSFKTCSAPVTKAKPQDLFVSEQKMSFTWQVFEDHLSFVKQTIQSNSVL